MGKPLPIDSQWLRRSFRPDRPRLIWTPDDNRRIEAAATSSEAVANLRAFVLQQASAMVELPVPARHLEGRRLLAVARRVLKRATMLAAASRLTREPRFADALDRLLRAVCSFSDWNPPHFLDTAELAVGVALALDWSYDDLSAETREMASRALLEHAVHPSFIPELAARLPLDSNWNQVCNAGVLAAALGASPPDPSLTVAVIQRLREWLPHVLRIYEPDGIYPEGPSYWSYGSAFHAIIVDILESSLGERFGLDSWSGFQKSAEAMHQLIAPSGEWFNFSDCGPRPLFDEAFIWFARQTGQRRYLQEPALGRLASACVDPAGPDFRLAAVALVWAARFEEKPAGSTPFHFHGRGHTPVVILRGGSQPGSLYFAFKGGSAATSHGHMDAGAFILEHSGVRWAIDPGNQDYHTLESLSRNEHDLWDLGQASFRWRLLSKNNFGHSTLTLSGELHQATGFAEVVRFDATGCSATLNLQPALGPRVSKAERTFSVIHARCVEIHDQLIIAEPGAQVRWQMMTQAEARTSADSVTLVQGGKVCLLELIDASEPARISVTELHPPPEAFDINMPGLKRVDILLPPAPKRCHEQILRVRLSGK